jgi:fibronectin-binding autotransporter adhesin
MKTKLLILGAATVLCATSQAQLISSESFFGYTPSVELPSDVPSPPVPGYTGNWTDISFGDVEPFTTNGSLAYAGAGYAAGIGQSIGKGADAAGIAANTSGRCFRVLDSSLVVGDTTEGIRYLSFLFQSGNEGTAAQPTVYTTLSLNNANADADGSRNFTLGIADGLGTSDYAFQVDNNGAMVSPFGPARDNGVHLFVIKFDLSTNAASDSVTAWIDPTLGAGEPAGGITFSGANLQFDRLVISDYASNSGYWDEIRWGTSFDSVTVTNPPVPPAVTAVANPSAANVNQTFKITATVVPGDGTVTNVSIDLSQIAGSAAASLVLSNANVYTNTFTVPGSAPVGAKTLTVSAKDTTPLVGSVGVAFAVLPNSRTWDGGSLVDSKWSRITNWVGEVGPSSSADSVAFAGTTRLTPDMDANYAIVGLLFDNTAGSFIISSSTGSTLTNGIGGITNQSANAQVLNVPMVMSGAQTFSAAAGNLTLSNSVTGGQSLNKGGPGTLTFAGAGTSSIGNTLITNGLFKVAGGVVNIAETSGALTKVDKGGAIEVSGGTLNIFGAGGWFPIGDTVGTTSMVTVAGGTLNVTNNFGCEVGRIGSGILNLNSGSMTVNDTGGVGLIIGDTGTAESGTVNLNGGTLTANLIRAFNGVNAIYFNGGTLQPTVSRNDWLNNATTLSVEVRNGGAVVDSAGFDITIGEPLFHSTVVGDNATDGGLTKVGNGTLILSGGYQYTGPTKVLGGALSLNVASGVPVTPGDLVVSNATLRLDASGGTPLPVANVLVQSGATLNLTNNAGASAISGTGNLTLSGGTTINLNYGALGGNPTAAALNVAGSLTTSGANVINLTGSGFVAGAFPLIDYTGTAVPTNTFVLGPLPAGVSAVLTNNASNTSLDLLITLIGNSLSWHGANADNTILLPTWDVNTSSNWYDAGFNLVKYVQYGGNTSGDLVTFGDNGYNTDGTNSVNLPGRVVPSSVTLNSSTPYRLTGSGGIDGATSVLVNNASPFFLGTSNNYSGGTFVNAGTLVITNDNALGASSGTLNMAGGTLQYAGSTTGTRPVNLAANSTVEVLGGVTAAVAGPVTGTGGLTKTGDGTLLFSGAGTNNIGDFVVSQGLLKITNGTVRANATQGNSKIDTGGSVEVAPGGALNITNGVNAWFPLGDTAGTTNTLTVNGGAVLINNNWGMEAPRQGSAVLTLNSGSMTVQDIGGVGLIMGDMATAESGVLNLNGGTLTVSLFRAFNGTNVFYFNGGTLRPVGGNANFFPSSAALSTQVRNGGAIVDTVGLNVSIAEPFDHSTVPGDNATDGGLTKIGNGTLNLNAVNSYNGTTVVNGGALGGTGTLAGALVNNATLAPGSGGIGTLTVNGNITLGAGSTNSFEVNGSTLAKDMVAAGASVTYGGVLNIVPSGTFTNGQTFTLFSGAGATSASSFASIVVNPGSGVGFGFTNGVLSVVATGPGGPVALTSSYSAGTLSLSWPAGQGWRLQTQTNSLATGLNTNWVYLTDGSVSSTNITVDPTKPATFFRLMYP